MAGVIGMEVVGTEERSARSVEGRKNVASQGERAIADGRAFTFPPFFFGAA
jgi:hypothetical protein